MHEEKLDNLERAKILIVDDQENNLVALKQTLETLDADIYLAKSGIEGLQYVTEHEFAVVLLDMYMPEMDGFEMAKLMRKNKHTESIPIVFVTAVSKEKIQVLKGYQAGAVDYLFKPIDPYILKSKIQIFLNIYYQKKQHMEKILQELQTVRSVLEKREQEIQDIDIHDPLTALPNRKQLEEEMNNCLRNARRDQQIFGFLYIDIDNFKHINDTLGQAVGDQLIKAIGEKIYAAIHSVGFMAHVGGDEFAIILKKQNHPNDASKVAQKLKDKFKVPINIFGHNIYVTLSIGIACYPLAGKTSVDLMKNAEMAMYRAKSLGKDNSYVFDQALYDEYTNLRKIESALRQALERNELYLVYQVIYRLTTREPVGVEALLRWKHPLLGDISPADFIKIAEDTGLIHHIGQWVIKKACQQFSEWNQNTINNFHFSINLSPEQLQKSDLLSTIREITSQIQFPKGLLELELSETTIMFHAHGEDPLLHELHKMGFKITIDDFGTSYSSLGILKNLPIDTIKIDRSFVKEVVENHNVSVIVKAIIMIAKGLGLRIVAEGIETKEQLDFFIREGCEEGQGFYLSKPQSATTITQLLAKVRSSS